MSSSVSSDGAAEPDASESYSVLQCILHAFKGEHHDYTTAPLQRGVILLAVPMVMEMLMESLFAVADVFWVSHLGKEAVAVIGLTESVMTLIYALAMGLAIAAAAVVARRIGEGRPDQASVAAGQTILLGVAVAALTGVALGLLSRSILEGMGADAATVRQGVNFTRIMLGGNVTVFLIFLINAIFRGAGDPVFSMRTLWLANGLNILLGPCFIFGLGPFPRLGIVGAAVATNFGRGMGVIYQLWHLAGGRGRITVKIRNLRPDFPAMAAVIRPAWSGVAQFLISTTSWIGLFKILALFGSTALAGYTIAIRVVIAAILPAWGLANAAATLVGQNLGAKQPERAEQAVRIAVRSNLVFLGSIGLIFLCCAPWIVRAFTSDPPVYANGVLAMRIVSLGFPLYAAGMCYQGAFNGAGDTWTPTRINFYFQWLGQVPLAWAFSRAIGLGPYGVYLAVPLSFGGLALSSSVLFNRGDWKKKML
ncbi:MAG TPA: MATE family efflux transporter [Opitutaceae bacterium]